MNGELVTVLRGDTDKYGNPNKEVHGTVSAIFAWGPGTSTNKYGKDQKFKGETSSLTAEVYVQRGSDVAARDRLVRGNGQVYRVVGHPSWDQADPFGGYDFGWMVLQVEAVNI